MLQKLLIQTVFGILGRKVKYISGELGCLKGLVSSKETTHCKIHGTCMSCETLHGCPVVLHPNTLICVSHKLCVGNLTLDISHTVILAHAHSREHVPQGMSFISSFHVRATNRHRITAHLRHASCCFFSSLFWF